MIKNNNFKTILLLLSFFFAVQYTFSQPPAGDVPADFVTPSDNPPTGDVPADFPAAPIDGYILPMALLGIAAGGYWLITKTKKDAMAK